jgi:hypothetical protein
VCHIHNEPDDGDGACHTTLCHLNWELHWLRGIDCLRYDPIAIEPKSS